MSIETPMARHHDTGTCIRCGITFCSKKWRICKDCRNVEGHNLRLWEAKK